MRIQPVKNNYVYPKCSFERKEALPKSTVSHNDCNVQTPINYYSSNISFGKIKNSEQLRALFAHGIPDLYSPIVTIDPKWVAKMMKIDAFEAPLKRVMQIFKPLEQSLFEEGHETKLYKIAEEYSKTNPDMDLKGVVQSILPVHTRRLRKKQAPIFKELDEMAQKLPDSHRYRYKLLRAETQDKLDYKPVVVRFSSKEFKYKLNKIKDYVAQRKVAKADRVMAKLVKEAEKLPSSSSYNAIEQQKK